MGDKIRILATGDWADTGFGTVMRSLFPRLARTGKYDIHLVGWHYRGQPDLAKEAWDAGITLYPTLGPEEGTVGGMMNDITGAKTCARLVQELKPDLFFALGDPWQMPPFSTREFEGTPKVFYIPVDTDVMEIPAVKAISRADVLVLYSQFGMDVLRNQAPSVIPEFIPHGVDTKVFRVQEPAQIEETRQNQDWPKPDPWVVMVVGQNQVRKGHPRALAAFKAATCAVFNSPEGKIEVETKEGVETFAPPSRWCEKFQKMRCDLCQHYKPDPVVKSWVLHFHCAQIASMGWNLVDLANRYGIQDRVKSTAQVRHDKGLPVEDLVSLMNAADVHLLLTHREGFGLPILEMMACGKPNVATDYSSVHELLEEGGGVPVPPVDFNVSNFHNAVDAMANIADAARGLRRLYEDRVFYEEQVAKGLALAKRLDWDALIPRWDETFQTLMARFRVTV